MPIPGIKRLRFNTILPDAPSETCITVADGKPVADKRTISSQYPTGCFGWLWGYDQNFNRTDSVCLDASGKAYDPTQLHDLAHVSHEIAFDFARAFQLDQQLVAQDSTPSYHLDLIEAALSADQFTVCISQASISSRIPT
jgi:hypothetical protein